MVVELHFARPGECAAELSLDFLNNSFLLLHPAFHLLDFGLHLVHLLLTTCLALDDILELGIDLLHIVQDSPITRSDFIELPPLILHTRLERVDLLHNRRLLLLQILHGSLRLLDVFLVIGSVDGGHLLGRLGLGLEIVQHRFHLLNVLTGFLVVLLGLIPQLLGLVRGFLHGLLLALIPRQLLLHRLHLMLRRLNRRGPIHSNCLLHATIISHHA
mmetsp:Transcript_18019/g.32646  ORF Transcript_18019/g.32646 Transcript_18019/m.32646 type:complete len:216 (+) Transcript_18019:990-1637(+)